MANTLKELKDRRDFWRDKAKQYVEHATKKHEEKHPEPEHIKCPLCINLHIIDMYQWVDSCRGYMSLGDFEMIVKLETGESVEYADLQ